MSHSHRPRRTDSFRRLLHWRIGLTNSRFDLHEYHLIRLVVRSLGLGSVLFDMGRMNEDTTIKTNNNAMICLIGLENILQTFRIYFNVSGKNTPKRQYKEYLCQ